MPIAMAQAKWPGWLAARTLVLPVPVARWAPPADGVTLDGVAFEPKRELYVTLVGGELGRELHAVLGQAALAEASRVAFEALDWSFMRHGCWLLLRKQAGVDGKPKVFHSLIERIDLPAMARFHFELGLRLGRQLAVPPPHVTLFTAGRAEGIGVASGRQLRAYAVRDVAAGELGDGLEVAESPPSRR